jgi:Uma2 family endonuclease
MTAITVPIKLERVTETSVKWVGERPITFTEFLEMDFENDWVELIDGVPVEKPMVQLDHEKLSMWLGSLLNMFSELRDLGIVLGSRTPVEIRQYKGRLPDLLFVRRERMDIVQQKAIFGPPDLVIEIVSPNDRRSDLLALIADYCSIGVAEIVMIERKKRRVRVLRKRDTGYSEEILSVGTLELESVEGFHVEVEWLLKEPRPQVREVLNRLLAETETP